MRLRFWQKGRAIDESPAGLPEPLTRPVTHRQFVKVLLGALGGAGLGLAASARSAQATYYSPGAPNPDRVDTNLTVEGNLLVGPSGAGNVGIGVPAPTGKLDVAGDIRVNGAVAIDTVGVAKHSYYAP